MNRTASHTTAAHAATSHAANAHAAQHTPVIELTDVVKTFHRPGREPIVAVDHTTWGVDRGEVVAFLGENGAGKSVSIDMILGLTKPTAGTVRVFGGTPQAAIRAGMVGAVLQQGELPKEATVKEVVTMIAAMHRDPQPVHTVMEQWNLADIAGTLIKKCSGGQLQRVRFALAMLGNPELIVLDEPTAGLDVTSRQAFWEKMHAEADRGRTLVFATHYLPEADEFADRIVVISRGKIVANGTPNEIRALTNHTRVRAECRDDRERARVIAAVKHHPEFAVESVTEQGTAFTIVTGKSDQLTRWLLTETPAQHLSITPSSLDDAFAYLTEKEPKPC